ncbi:hypothetical protein [Pajaroellobacter abortibovis]|uniref:Uncharacterized protein n=1 Tax=Pajaroellobacter abortibovis TaxID=1882918 RepID=A0A1L6MXI3_9BACT|nr:hypothetical protein [Pajaroellobacter abortibovis]APS00108.1 hypothetical protein BCY86_04995 [Pajaroellobacter abortibovis]
MGPTSKQKEELAALRHQLQTQAKTSGASLALLGVRSLLARGGVVLAVLWMIALCIFSFWHSTIPLWVAGVFTLLGGGGILWVVRYIARAQVLSSLLQKADTEEGRRQALEEIRSSHKKDIQSLLAKAHLEMQQDPYAALSTLESIDLNKQMRPIADQVRSMRAMIHLMVGETRQARALVDEIELGKQQDPKIRAMFATVVGEAWSRTGEASKAVAILELFNPEDPLFADMKIQMWRARAFAYAGMQDRKGVERTLNKLAKISPQLVGMFLGQKRIHPLLESEAKRIFLSGGSAPKKVIRGGGYR